MKLFLSNNSAREAKAGGECWDGGKISKYYRMYSNHPGPGAIKRSDWILFPYPPFCATSVMVLPCTPHHGAESPWTPYSLKHVWQHALRTHPQATTTSCPKATSDRLSVDAFRFMDPTKSLLLLTGRFWKEQMPQNRKPITVTQEH